MNKESYELAEEDNIPSEPVEDTRRHRLICNCVDEAASWTPDQARITQINIELMGHIVCTTDKYPVRERAYKTLLNLRGSPTLTPAQITQVDMFLKGVAK